MLTYTAMVHRVAILDDPACSGVCVIQSEKLIRSFGPEVQVERVPMRNLTEKDLVGFSAVVVPGGSLYAYSIALGKDGENALRKFVQTGGAYIGTCAGAYLGADLGLLPVRAALAQSSGPTTVRLTKSGGNLSAEGAGKVRLYYQNGPTLEVLPNTDPKAVEILGYFDTSRGQLDGSIAIVGGNFGKGKVFLFSPHPELSEGNEDLFSSALISGLLERPKN